jgi:Domain of unknown function (DUF4365)
MFFVQAKAYSNTNRLRIRDGRYLSIPVDSDHIRSWSSLREPVLLAVWDSSRDVTYWQTIQTAVSVAERRARFRGTAVPMSRVWVPIQNVLDVSMLERIEKRVAAAWSSIERERNGAKVLTDALRNQLGLEISYDPRYGTISIPAGRFVPDPASGDQMYTFGRAARDIRRIAEELGVSHQEAFERAMLSLYADLKAVVEGSALAKTPNGQPAHSWRSVDEVNEHFFQMFEQGDED